MIFWLKLNLKHCHRIQQCRQPPYFYNVHVNEKKNTRLCWKEIHDGGVWGARFTLRWRHNGHGGVSNHQPHDCLPNRLFGGRSKKTSKLRAIHWGPVNSPHKWPATRKMFPFADVIMNMNHRVITPHITGLCEGNALVTDGSPHKGSVTRKMFSYHDFIVIHICEGYVECIDNDQICCNDVTRASQFNS